MLDFYWLFDHLIIGLVLRNQLIIQARIQKHTKCNDGVLNPLNSLEFNRFNTSSLHLPYFWICACEKHFRKVASNMWRSLGNGVHWKTLTSKIRCRCTWFLTFASFNALHFQITSQITHFSNFSNLLGTVNLDSSKLGTA